MPPVHDTTTRTIQDIFNEVESNLYTSGLKWYSQAEILTSIQDQYNKFVAQLTPIEYSTFIPKINSPYYPLSKWIPDFMYVSAIYNPAINKWLPGIPYRLYKAQFTSYLAAGQPQFFSIIDFVKVLIWPYLSDPTDVLYLIYKASAPLISLSHVPLLPYSVAAPLLEYAVTADLLEQAREFTKAQIWWDRIFGDPLSKKIGQKSLFQQAKDEIQSLARTDRELVLEPYRWIFHGGQYNVAQWINNETPVGDIDGTNNTYTLAQVPNPTSSLLLTKNGQILYNGIGYVLSGQTITIQSSYTLASDDYLRAWYQVA